MNSFWIGTYTIFIFISHIQFKSANVVVQVQGKYGWENCHGSSTNISYTIELCEGKCQPTQKTMVKRSIVETDDLFYQLLFSFKLNGIC